MGEERSHYWTEDEEKWVDQSCLICLSSHKRVRDLVTGGDDGPYPPSDPELETRME